MRHALQLYFRRGMKELADFEGAGGLDKIWRFAPGMVQSSDSPHMVFGAISAGVK